MWQYNNTENIGVKQFIDNRLYHSDTYLGMDYTNGIKHWKYIKKIKKPNGKWKYIYKDTKTESWENLIKEEKKDNERHKEITSKSFENRRYGINKSMSVHEKNLVYMEAQRRNSANNDKVRKAIAKSVVKTLNNLNNSIDKGKQWFKKIFK